MSATLIIVLSILIAASGLASADLSTEMQTNAREVPVQEEIEADI